jgi:hypothetical protein
MQNGVPKAFRTPFLKSSKTKTKTKYLKLAFRSGWLLEKWVKSFQPIVT